VCVLPARGRLNQLILLEKRTLRQCGPVVARAAAEVAVTRRSCVVGTTVLGLGRFDEEGNSRLAADLARWAS
jgi:hypothetical protein